MSTGDFHIVKTTMLLHALGDTIGFKNGDWEFNYMIQNITLDFVNDMIYEFINLGGINSIDLSDWSVSDDTIFHMGVARTMLSYKPGSKTVTDKLIIQMKSDLIDSLKRSNANVEKGEQIRYVGRTTADSVMDFELDSVIRSDEYNPKGGGNGCAMRTLVIGLCLHRESQLDELINISVTNSLLTHNNAIGYLGGFTAAYFTSLAVRKINILEWPYLLIEQLKSDRLVSFIKKTVSKETRDYMDYITYWEKHVDNRFAEDRSLRQIKIFSNPMYRIKYYYDQFMVGTESLEIGGSGLSAMIMAYDAVLDSNGVWEKLIMFGMLHPGDSDTVGAISGGLFGAYYGFSDVPLKMLEHLEFRDEIEKIAEKIEKKYFD